jgi:ABC-2 type transport system ATP-binding protein
MADRIGVIDKGKLILAEQKDELMKKLGKKRLTLSLTQPLAAIPRDLAEWQLTLGAHGRELVYAFSASAEHASIPRLLAELGRLGIDYKDLDTRQSSLEEIFVSLVSPSNGVSP